SARVAPNDFSTPDISSRGCIRLGFATVARMRDGFRLYDTHTHLGVARHSGARRTADQALRAMDANGVDRAVLIPFPVVESYREAHDEIGRACRDHPDRFTGAACIDPFIPEAEYRDEVRRCAEQLGFRALKFQPQYQG